MNKKLKYNYSEKIVPTLDVDGWVRYSNRDKLDRLLSYFFTTDAGQSSMYENINTYQSINAANAGDVAKFREELNYCLDIYLKKYFDNIEVKVYITDLAANVMELENISSGAVGIKLEIEYLDNYTISTFDKEVIYNGKGLFYYILDKFNNGGY